MLRIRLSRTGAKKQPSYRIVVADADAKRDGRIVERIGHYNPRTEPLEYAIDEDRALYWLSVGAQPTDSVRLLLTRQGTFERLGRLRKGESRESLIAEYLGVDQVFVDDFVTQELEDEEIETDTDEEVVDIDAEVDVVGMVQILTAEGEEE